MYVYVTCLLPPPRAIYDSNLLNVVSLWDWERVRCSYYYYTAGLRSQSGCQFMSVNKPISPMRIGEIQAKEIFCNALKGLRAGPETVRASVWR